MSVRNRISLAASVLALAGLANSAFGQNKPADMKTIELKVSPKAAPEPAFRYRLFPLESERTPGDAVPIYLRLASETKDEALDQIRSNSSKWLDLPIRDLPAAEARKFVDQFRGRLKQLEYGARRQTAQWNYTIPEEKENAIEILLPDLQELRTRMNLLAIKARVEIAEKKYDEAIRTIETGLSVSRHIAEGPFLINGLVGIATAQLFLNRIEDLIAQPDAPNLYWALTALPRPLIDLRKEMETEQKVIEWIIPELTDLDMPRTDAEWESRLARIHGRWNGLVKLIDAPVVSKQTSGAPAPPAAATPKPIEMVDTDLAKFQAAILPEAKTFVKSRRGSIDGLSDAQVIVLYIAGQHREIRDQSFQPSYLPYPEAVAFYAVTEKSHKALTGAVPRLFAAFAPALMHAHTSEVRLDRRVAMLRVMEAVRLQAAADRGVLPQSLDEVKVVPVPNDPATGRAFGFRRDGDVVVLEAPGLTAGQPGVSYRISLRK